MAEPLHPDSADVMRAARRLDDLLTANTAASSADVRRACDDLLAAIAQCGPQYAFDRQGRPGAIAAVREALPLMERDLFDAIVEDHACEVAAFEEALRQLAKTRTAS